MTFNCRFETPCGWCEKFDKECKEVCGTPKNDRFNVKPEDVNRLIDNIRKSQNNPMDSVNFVPLSTQTIKGCK